MFKKDTNKRSFNRVDMTQASFCIPMGDFIKSDPFNCWVNNISKSGISIDVNAQTKLKVDDHITVTYTLGGEKRNDRVQVKHTLTVINNLRCGCVFVDEDKERNQLIQAYIKHVDKIYTE